SGEQTESRNDRGDRRADASPAVEPEPRSSEPRHEHETPTPMEPRASVEPDRPTPEPVEPRQPKRPVDNWVIFREGFEGKKDVVLETQWTGRNQFEIRTDNVRRMTIDMTRVPEGAPRKGPWILHVDGQGVELTGFTPKPGYTGLRR